MDKFQNIYRIPSHRMPKWDYAGNGIYYITICVNYRKCIFGKIKKGKMILNVFGKIAHDNWIISAQIRQEIALDAFVIMPNHMHGIVILDNRMMKNEGNHGNNSGDVHVETHGRASLRETFQVPIKNPNNPNQQLHRKPKSISSFIAGYKSAVTSKINDLIIENGKNGKPELYTRRNKLWQVNYNDHIIRNEKEYYSIKNYINNNPANWENDEFNG